MTALLATTHLTPTVWRRVIIDIETRSACDLKVAGAYAYAEHPTTQITRVGYTIDGVTRMWRTVASSGPGGRPAEPMPDDLFDVLFDPTVILVAHNAGFERTVMSGHAGRALGIPDLSDITRWDCTAARAACFGLPRKLEDVCEVLKLQVKKDKAGHALMLRMCKPRTLDPLTWWDDEERETRMDAYCADDCRAEDALDRFLPALKPRRRRAWEVTEAINDRGIKVDTDLLLAMLELVDKAETQLNTDLHRLTCGAIPKVTNHAAFTRWLVAQGYASFGETGCGKSFVAEQLETFKTIHEARDLTAHEELVETILQMRQDGGGSSSKKYAAIMKRISLDGRIRGVLVFCGAASTGRWSSRGAQLQNLVRGGKVDNIMQAMADIYAGATLDELAWLHGAPLVVASELLRPLFIA